MAVGTGAVVTVHSVLCFCGYSGESCRLQEDALSPQLARHCLADTVRC